MPQAQELQAPPASKDLVVFSILRESKCTECGKEIWRGGLLSMEKGQPLCMACADLDHLVILPRGDAALTRRAKKHSGLWAVIVRFSRSRGRYERQGLLVEEAALQQAEEECAADEDKREARREVDAERRVVQDQKLTAAMANAIRELFPGCSPKEAQSIAAHTTVRGSGRVGRTAAGQSLDAGAITAAAIAAIRHNHTRYDALLMKGVERFDARAAIREDLDRGSGALAEAEGLTGLALSDVSWDRDPVPQVSDIHVGTPKRGSTQRITAK